MTHVCLKADHKILQKTQTSPKEQMNSTDVKIAYGYMFR